MVLYIILEGVLVRTRSGQDIPGSLSDMVIDVRVLDWIRNNNFTDIVVLSNQTWIFNRPGSHGEEGFWSKLKYILECIREVVPLGTRIHSDYSIKRPWMHGLIDGGPSLVEYIWECQPGLKEQESIYLCRPIEFDTNYAKKLGLTNIKTFT